MGDLPNPPGCRPPPPPGCRPNPFDADRTPSMQTPPPRGQTRAWENITLPQTSSAGGKYLITKVLPFLDISYTKYRMVEKEENEKESQTVTITYFPFHFPVCRIPLVARWRRKAWCLDTRGFILKKIQWHIHAGPWSLVNWWHEVLTRHYIRCSWILMTVAVGLMEWPRPW